MSAGLASQAPAGGTAGAVADRVVDTGTGDPGTGDTGTDAVVDDSSTDPRAEGGSDHGVRRLLRRVDPRTLFPIGFAVLNAVVFVLVRPDVNDLWAARARASAVTHGVGLFYWFGWFGGGSTPGNYSVLTPFLCAYLGTEVVGALAAVAISVQVTVLVARTPHPNAAVWVAAVAAAANLWSGRVPFLVGCAFGVGALLALQAHRRAATVALTGLTIVGSPVAGAFLALGLAGVFVTTRTRSWRPIIGYAAATVGVGLIGVALVFGTPGPEPFSVGLAAEIAGGLVLLRWAGPRDHVRTLLALTAIATVLLYAVPNGMGSNFGRFVWFCLPVLVVATSGRRTRAAVLAVVPLLVVGASTTVTDLRNAARPISTVAYYDSLAAQLDQIPGLRNCRVEVVSHGAHAGYDGLLEHASLARGWETQEDLALNAPLDEDPLNATAYKVWLDNSAVCYVALPATAVQSFPEYTLVAKGRPRYLHEVWHDPRWRLFRVADSKPIVAAPSAVVGHTQSSLTIRVPCACSFGVRIRYSRYLNAALLPPAGGRTRSTRPAAVLARITDDGTGWTVITTTRPGEYRITGSIAGLIR